MPIGRPRGHRGQTPGEIDGVEQLARYLEFLDRDPMLRPVQGVFVAQQIKPQAQVLAGPGASLAWRSTTTAPGGYRAGDLRLF